MDTRWCRHVLCAQILVEVYTSAFQLPTHLINPTLKCPAFA